MDADHQKSAFASKRGVPKCPFGELYVLHFQTDDFFKTKFCGKQDIDVCIILCINVTLQVFGLYSALRNITQLPIL